MEVARATIVIISVLQIVIAIASTHTVKRYRIGDPAKYVTKERQVLIRLHDVPTL